MYAAIRGQIVLAGVHLSLAAVRASPGLQLPHQGHTSAPPQSPQRSLLVQLFGATGGSR